MNIENETIKLKKELVILRMDKITKQKNERHRTKQVQHKISQILQINHHKNN
uniref:ribosomal protein L29 n=1 Tax=Lophurella stichidiosa TaxID=2008659 RepID=UPI002551EAAC|nr:ribosomal protein L29 [Aphanocladia stichidiosa]WGH14066.1 ribosomal protein L29 [Aphanocladia stichidiosa]